MYVPFTGLGLHDGYRGDKWLLNRIKIFKEFVIPSLMAQSNQNFIIWISMRPEEENNPIVQELAESLFNLRGLKVIFTFHGVCFWDDKYDYNTAFRRLSTSLQKTLPELEESIGESEEILMTIQPSDDIYFSDFIEKMQNEWLNQEIQCWGFDKGYIMNYSNMEMAEYNPTTTPPFYTIKFPTKIFLDHIGHMYYTGPYESHEYVKHYLNRASIQGRGFIVGTHGENISTTYIHPYRGRVLGTNETDDLLIKAGLWNSKPITFAPNGRLIARRILNSLPFQNIIRDYYYKLPLCLRIF